MNELVIHMRSDAQNLEMFTKSEGQTLDLLLFGKFSVFDVQLETINTLKH